MKKSMVCNSSPPYHDCYAFPAIGTELELGLFRVGGCGLGNLLFTWARCLVRARQYGLTRISPTWTQFCRGPWLRNDPDKRTYHNLFNNAPDEITGIERTRLLIARRKVSESQLGSSLKGGSIVVFRGFSEFLMPSIPYRQLVCTELLRIVRTEHKKAIQSGFSPDIAIHVRMGDFYKGSPASDITRLNIGWYIDILKKLRDYIGNLTTTVFSDGTDEELYPLLALNGVKRVGFGSSMADIIGLSQARIFIASGSTFSMWASFMGYMPTVWYPGRLYHPILNDPRREIATFGEVPKEFIDQCVASLEHRPNLLSTLEDDTTSVRA